MKTYSNEIPSISINKGILTIPYGISEIVSEDDTQYSYYVISVPVSPGISQTRMNEIAQESLISELYKNIKQFIEYQPNGYIRYDSDLKLNILNASTLAGFQAQSEPEACSLFRTWITTVQVEFFALKTAIINGDLTTDISVETLESKYGREGTTLPDPGVSTDDLV